jgi:hypothetical protein
MMFPGSIFFADPGEAAITSTPSVSKYKMFYLCEANVFSYLLVCRFTRIYTLKRV